MESKDIALLTKRLKDYYEFQQLLLGKDVLLITDVEVIKSKEKDPQCRLGTIRMLVEPNYKARSILYFRGTTSKEHKTAAFMEWPSEYHLDYPPSHSIYTKMSKT